jgi:histidinol-phosphate aminotransferase
LFALEHADTFAEQAATIRAERTRLIQGLQGIAGATPFPSDANMVLVRWSGGDAQAQAVFEGLKARKVLVKNVSKMHPLLSACLRLTVGTPAENTLLLDALRDLASA